MAAVISLLRAGQHLQMPQESTSKGELVTINQSSRLVHPQRITELADIRASVDALTPQERWNIASESQRSRAHYRLRLLRPVLDLVSSGVKDRTAILNTIARIESRDLQPDILDLANQLSNKNSSSPSKATFYNWLRAYREHGMPGLLPAHTGRVRQTYGWEIAALRLFHIPSKPGYGDVAFTLNNMDIDVTAKQIERLIKALPAEYGPDSPWRVGQHFYRQNLGGFKRMNHGSLEVGQVYQGDGHTCDAYVEHPHSGYLYRAELTIWIDIRSHYVVGHHLSAAESGETTLYALSNALMTQDHIPDYVHIDNGSGFVNQMMTQKTTGFFERFGIEYKKAIPGNSKGKGLVERWFGIFRNRHDKFWNGGKDYCGHDLAEETNRRINDQLKRGDRTLLPYELYKTSVASFIHAYNHTKQKSLGGMAPADLWETLKRNTVELPEAAVVRPQYKRKVRRLTVSIFNREYEHKLLASYHKQELIVEVDLLDDSRVWIHDLKGRLICIAELKTKRDWALASITEDRQAKREQGRLGRIQKKIDLVKAEEAKVFDYTDTLAMLNDAPAYTNDNNEDDLDIDITQGLSDDDDDLDLGEF